MTDKTITVTLKLDLNDLAAQFRAAADALTDRYAANEARQREEAARDPLDENDHSDRIDKYGRIVRRKGFERWAWPSPQGWKSGTPGLSLRSINTSVAGPLTFAPDASPAPQDAAQDAAEGADDAVEGGGTAGPPEALLCHECGHDIDHHDNAGPGDRRCWACIHCNLAPSDIARHLIAQATS